MSTRPPFTSKTAWEALGIESGEEVDDEEYLDDAPASQPESGTESNVKLSKSAIKKQKALARAEKRQQEKAARAAARAQKADVAPPSPAVSPPHASTPLVASEPVITDALDVSPTPPAEKAAELAPAVTPAPTSVVSKPVSNGAAYPATKANGSAPRDPPAETTPAPAAVPSVKPLTPASEPAAPASSEKDAHVVRRPDIESPPEKAPTVEDSEKVKKRQSFITRTLWTFIMIGGFITLLLMGHAYMIMLVMLCQAVVYREVTALFSLKRKVGGETDLRGRDPWSKTLNWYFFVVTNYFLYGESIIYYFKHVVFSNAQLTPFATNHRFASFSLYLIGFVGFVLSLKRGYLKQQFGLFCWVHMSLLMIVVSSHFIVNNILEGLIWFWVPASLVICNDVFAYIWGITVGRTPLIKLSPKKTVEGFIGAFFSTIIFGLLWGTYFMRFDYMICPVRDLGVSAFGGELHCKPNPIFVWHEWVMPLELRTVVSPLLGSNVTTIPYVPYQPHLLVLSCFASLVAPFGGFFASGFKRAFDIKDFGHSIPGHGGMTDRMDCQFLMGIFTYVYYSSLIRQNNVTVGSVLQTIVGGLTVQEQLELLGDLKRLIESQGIVVNL
ncbi:phosphatidate cytidylyltransferase [Epithele typhae]|uniref:phosphatidate cytidylyltransferase n=1 Tax=Epithele typhae TaxID=378194 RepID=UPI002008D1A8|nr:phosphatidate cytidylyltransferase [Epithele typhae]KAH9929609.1 phosphatidate cytidylyltransferase [Epithele typhae]